MKKKVIFAALFLFLFALTSVSAQVGNPVGRVLEENGGPVEEETLITGGESYTASAPLKVSFEANPNEQEGYTYAYEWVIYPADTPDEPLLRRFEPDTEYTFYDSGTFGVQLKITYTPEDGSAEPLEEEAEPIVIVISESSLKVPNAFSPNGDGVNDVFHITYQSLVKLEASIFNRWGQRICQMNLSNIDQGWDGTHGGRDVKDGVYFIVVQAVGSDGIKYEVKQDINILRGLGGLNGGGSGGY
ncbi:MAG: gliding motility-associated C-terminal domain-containing protein [Bacteroidaceae bacterium]|nr:gliding motility-associated C-terminal domain-containing protein [Bacteroidaceae bacterium]